MDDARCYFCGFLLNGSGPLAGAKLNMHHPDREADPDFEVPAHEPCHVKFHRLNGDFVAAGAKSSGAGRLGYGYAIAAWPEFHSLGGKARSRSARRDTLGRFVKA